MNDALMPVAVLVAVGALLYFFNRGSISRAGITEDGLTELKVNKLYLLIGGAGLLVSVMWLLMPILVNEYTPEIFIASGIIFLVFGSFSVLMLLWYRNHVVKFNAVALTVTDAYGVTRQVNWNKLNDYGL